MTMPVVLFWMRFFSTRTPEMVCVPPASAKWIAMLLAPAGAVEGVLGDRHVVQRRGHRARPQTDQGRLKSFPVPVRTMVLPVMFTWPVVSTTMPLASVVPVMVFPEMISVGGADRVGVEEDAVGEVVERAPVPPSA